MKYIATVVLVIIFSGFLFLIIKGGVRMQSESSTMRTECNATNYYTIGDKGHLKRIYECPSDTFKQ